MESVAGSVVIGGLISSYLPIEDNSLKVQLGILGSQAITYIFNKSNFRIFDYFRRQEHKLLIFNKYENSVNPIFYHIEEYFIKKYISEIKNLQLIPKNGDITFSSSQQEFRKELIDIYNNHQIKLSINRDDSISNNDQSKNKNADNSQKSSIMIMSKTATLDTLKEYAEFICNTSKPDTSIITIYKIKVTNYEKTSHVEWETVYIKTNKNLKNTIVPENIEKELFHDIRDFCKNEEWFSKKGIPYKRGYILYGPPGTGKTSIIKAIANMYQLPIFNLDLSSIKTNTDMLKLVTEINYIAKNKKYIVTIEDIDRCPIFSTNSYDRRYQLPDNTLTVDCLLNVLDGIIETHGRLFFLTANNMSVFNNIKDVLFRPGRIDKQLNIGYCTKPQITKIISNFYDLEPNEIEEYISELNDPKITPAIIMKHLQESPDNFNTLYDNFIKNRTNNIDITNHDADIKNIKSKKFNIRSETDLKQRIREIKKKITNYTKRIEYHKTNREKLDKNIAQQNEELEKYTLKLTNLKEKIKLDKIKEKEKLKNSKKKSSKVKK